MIELPARSQVASTYCRRPNCVGAESNVLQNRLGMAPDVAPYGPPLDYQQGLDSRLLRHGNN